MKGANQNIKDFIIKNIHEEMPHYSEDLIEKIVAFQGEDMLQVVKEHTQIEVSGFGVFYLSPTKVAREIKSIENNIARRETLELPEEKVEGNQKIINDYRNRLEFLKNKQNEGISKINSKVLSPTKADSGGVEECS